MTLTGPTPTARRGAALAPAALLTWGLAAWAVGLGLVGYQLRFHPGTAPYDYAVEGGTSAPVLTALAALLLARQRRHRVTHLCVALALAVSVQLLTGSYAHVSLLAHGGRWPMGPAAAWAASLAQTLAAVAFIGLLWLFPTGRLAGARWRLPATVAAAGLLCALIGAALSPGALDSGTGGTDNPLGPAALARVVGLLNLVSLAAVPVAVGGAVLNPILRFRRSRGPQRQQLKWFAWATAVALVLLVFGGEGTAGSIVWTVGPLLVVAAIAVAILRYRLYDIDRIISRSLAYAFLSALLAGVYVAAVSLITAVTAPVAGESPVAVAAATLAAAALFRPARRRIQAAVDQRFNRARYDAARAVDSYRAGLRDQLDLDAITTDLLGAVHGSLQPATAILWLRHRAGASR